MSEASKNLITSAAYNEGADGNIMTSIKHMFCSNQMSLLTATYSLYLPACKQSFEHCALHCVCCSVHCSISPHMSAPPKWLDFHVSTITAYQHTAIKKLLQTSSRWIFEAAHPERWSDQWSHLQGESIAEIPPCFQQCNNDNSNIWATREARTYLLFIHKNTAQPCPVLSFGIIAVFFCSSAAMGRRTRFREESRREDGEVSARKRQNERRQACRNHNREHLSSSGSLKAASTSLFSRARHRRRRGDTVRARGRGTGDISTQYLISLPSLMHPGVSSPAQTRADR